MVDQGYSQMSEAGADADKADKKTQYNLRSLVNLQQQVANATASSFQQQQQHQHHQHQHQHKQHQQHSRVSASLLSPHQDATKPARRIHSTPTKHATERKGAELRHSYEPSPIRERSSSNYNALQARSDPDDSTLMRISSGKCQSPPETGSLYSALSNLMQQAAENNSPAQTFDVPASASTSSLHNNVLQPQPSSTSLDLGPALNLLLGICCQKLNANVSSPAFEEARKVVEKFIISLISSSQTIADHYVGGVGDSVPEQQGRPEVDPSDVLLAYKILQKSHSPP